jgi:hypothetical protein
MSCSRPGPRCVLDGELVGVRGGQAHDAVTGCGRADEALVARGASETLDLARRVGLVDAAREEIRAIAVAERLAAPRHRASRLRRRRW